MLQPSLSASILISSSCFLFFLLLLHLPTGYYCQVSWDDFESSRVPIKDWKGLMEVLRKRNYNPAADLLTPQVIAKYGYPVESHKVTTKDGYILTMHRIPYGKHEQASRKQMQSGDLEKPVVFLQHGLFASSFEWFMNTPDKLLVLQLADSGYDVWLGNARGNAYSREHTNRSLTVRNRDFWQFSVNEMGKYDIPAEIDYILQKTGQKQLSYVGFSMGTTMFWVFMSHHPDYASKVKVMTAMAPVAYLHNAVGFPRFIAPVPGSDQFVGRFLDFIGNGEFLPPWLLRMYRTIYGRLCSYTYIAETLCGNLVFMFAGWDLPQSQINQLPLFFTHTPSPTSVRTMVHLAQFINSGHFREYNYGRRENLKRYGTAEPPNYKLKNVKVPVALIYGPNDGVVNPIDVGQLSKALPNVILDMPVNFTLWNHFDYHLGKDTNELVYQHVLKLLGKYNDKN